MFENNIRKENLVLGCCSKYFLNPPPPLSWHIII